MRWRRLQQRGRERGAGTFLLAAALFVSQMPAPEGTLWFTLSVYGARALLLSFLVMAVTPAYLAGELILCVGGQAACVHLWMAAARAWSVPGLLAILSAVAFSVVLACFYSALDRYLRLPAIYFTFAMETILSGAASFLAGGLLPRAVESRPGFFEWSLAGFPVWLFLWAGAACLLSFFFHRMTAGRCVFYAGEVKGGRRRPSFCLPSVKRAVYLIAALLITVYSILNFSRMRGASWYPGTSVTYDALAAAGLALWRGRERKKVMGRILSASVAVVCFNGLMQTIFSSPEAGDIVKGLLILSSVSHRQGNTDFDAGQI